MEETDNYKKIKQFLSEKTDHKDDIVYSNIFNILSNNDTSKNYSYNDSGIFFNYESLSEDVINDTVSYINTFYRKRYEIENYENIRQQAETTCNKKQKDIMQQLSDNIQFSLNNDTSTKIDSDSDSMSNFKINVTNDYDDFEDKTYNGYTEKDLFGDDSD